MHPISSHDAGIQLSHHIGFFYSHQLMICDLELISISASQNPINRTSDSYSKQAIQKHDSQIINNYQRLTQVDEAMKNKSSKSEQLAG